MPARTRSINELRREIRAKEKDVAKLRARRANLARQLAAVDKDIADLVGGARGAPRRRKKTRRAPGRPRRARKRATGKPLKAYVQQVLSGKTSGMRVNEIVDAVRKAGYRSSSKDFYAIVAKLLLTDDTFKRVKRGVYKLAG